ncbi:MAG: kelch repeat-containing protein, partial [Candidatus Anstonellales archaeon]
MCFVPTQNKVYLFGGNFQGYPLNDMWVFDLNTMNWQKINLPQTAPQARWGHKMLYVEKHKKIYIFGGQKDYTPSGLLYDLWWYDISNNTFFEIKNPQSDWPVGLSHFSMSYNKATDSLIVFGGYKSENPNYSNEVWFFNIVSTSFVKSPILYLNSPEGIEKSCLVNIADKFLVYGGFNGTSCLNKTYYYHYSSSGSATS